jgi:hypothetical protein
LGSASVRRQKATKERIDEDLVIALHGVAREAAFGGNVREVHQLGIRERRCPEEAREGGKVSNQALGRDFPLEVVVYVCGAIYIGPSLRF